MLRMQNSRSRGQVTVQAISNMTDLEKLEDTDDVSELRHFYHERALKFYSTMVQFLLKRYVTDDNIAKMNAEVCNFRQGSVTPTEFTQELGTKTLSFDSVCNKKSLQDHFVEIATNRIRKTLRH